MRWSTRSFSSSLAGWSAPAVNRSVHSRLRWLRTRYPSTTCSRTVRPMNSSSCWKVRASPRRDRFEGDAPVTFLPPRNTSPPCGWSRPDSTPNSVVLPAPLGPTSPTIDAGRDRQADVVERDQPAEAHGHVAGFDRRGVGVGCRRFGCGRLGCLDGAHDPATSAVVPSGCGDRAAAAGSSSSSRGSWRPANAVAAGTGRAPPPEALCSIRWSAHRPLVHGALGVLGEGDGTETEEQDRQVGPRRFELEHGLDERGGEGEEEPREQRGDVGAHAERDQHREPDEARGGWRSRAGSPA